MKLTTRCTSCGIDMYMNTWHSTRSELQMKKGDHIEFNCKHCGKLINQSTLMI